MSKKKKSLGQYWVYKHGDGVDLKYLFGIDDLDESEIMQRCQPYFTSGKSYLFDSSVAKIVEYPDAVYRFGVTYASPDFYEPGFCWRCSSKGIMMRGNLVCPRCKYHIGGIG